MCFSCSQRPIFKYSAFLPRRGLERRGLDRRSVLGYVMHTFQEEPCEAVYKRNRKALIVGPGGAVLDYAYHLEYALRGGSGAVLRFTRADERCSKEVS